MDLFLAIYNYLLFNVNKKKLFFNFLILLIISSLTFLIGYKQRDNKINHISNYNNYLSINNKNLTQLLQQDSLDLKMYNSIIQNKHYIRYIAYIMSDVHIPEDINHSDLKIINRMSVKFNIPQRYVYRLIYQESRFNPNAGSNKGARGYMQIMPATFRSMSTKYINNYGPIKKYTKNQQNIIIGVYYIKYLYDIYQNWNKVFSHYNAGPNKHNITNNYVNFILK